MRPLFAGLVIACVLCGALTGAVEAKLYTFTFDPNDLVNLTAAITDPGGRATQINNRSITDTASSPNEYTTFGTEADHNTYQNWLSGLDYGEPADWTSNSRGEGIQGFYVFLGGTQASYDWGQTVRLVPGGSITDATGDGGGTKPFWTASFDSTSVTWRTAENQHSLRPGGTDIASFTFTADLFNDANWNGIVDPGEEDLLAPNNRLFFQSRTVRYDANHWGSQSPAAGPWDGVPLNNDNTSQTMWRGTLGVATAAVPAIPEPVFFQFGALMGLSGLGVLKLRRR